MCHDNFCHPSSASTRLKEVPSWSEEYKKLQMNLVNSWKHPGKQKPVLFRVFQVVWPCTMLEPFISYKTRVNFGGPYTEEMLYHGTGKHCKLGERSWFRMTTDLCAKLGCPLCGVLRSSLDVSKCGNGRMFGKGIYLSGISSKADGYVSNIGGSKGVRTLILARTVSGKKFTTMRNIKNLVSPPAGYDSVFGAPGAELRYEETILYDNRAVRPAYLLMYKYK